MSIKAVLVPLGMAPNTQETLQYAVDFCKDFEAKIFIIDVFTVTTGAGSLAKVEDKVLQNRKQIVKDLVAQVNTRGLDLQLVSYNGELVEGIKALSQELAIDLIVLSAKSNSINEELYLGATTGKIIKQTNIPALIVPRATTYNSFKNILVAFKSGVVKAPETLNPLKAISQKFSSAINLLLVKTPGYTQEDLQLNTALLDLSGMVTISNNQTTYLGVIEHFKDKNPDLLCVFRRKRGFFAKLWEKSTILKSEFFVPVPVLVLGVKQ